jgi:hypothetical protein
LKGLVPEVSARLRRCRIGVLDGTQEATRWSAGAGAGPRVGNSG